MRNLQKLSENLDQNLLTRYRSEAESLADSILDSSTVQEDTTECCLALLTCRAMLNKIQQEADLKNKTYQKEMEALSEQIHSFQKESAQLKQEVSGYRNELDSLRLHLQDRSFRMLQLYMQNAEQEEELAGLRGIPAPASQKESMLTLQLQLKALESEKQIQLDRLHLIQQQRNITHEKIKKLKEAVISGTVPAKKHMLTVLSMEIFQDTLKLKEQELRQVQDKISEFDIQQETLAQKIESAFAKNGGESLS